MNSQKYLKQNLWILPFVYEQFVGYVEMVFTMKIPRLPNSKKFLLIVMKQMIL